MKKFIRGFVAGVVMVAISAMPAMAGHWGYEGQDGVYAPEDWGHVSEFCNGASQSPIDIQTKKVIRGGADISFDQKGDTVEYINNGHAVVVNPAERSITVNGKLYTLVQFHFHTLSEHTVDGRFYDMEMHMVHADDAWLAGDTVNGRLAVLGVFIKRGDKNETLEKIFEELPPVAEGEEPEIFIAKMVTNYGNLLPRDSKVFSYQGSLTTPTCNEVVSWFVYEKPIELSGGQIEAYRALYHNEDGSRYDTNRPIQPLNGRVVSYGSITN